MTNPRGELFKDKSNGACKYKKCNDRLLNERLLQYIVNEKSFISFDGLFLGQKPVSLQVARVCSDSQKKGSLFSLIKRGFQAYRSVCVDINLIVQFTV